MTPNQAGVIALVASTATGAVAGAVIYYVLHIYRYGPNARTPLTAWLRARREIRDIDRELDKILNPKG